MKMGQVRMMVGASVGLALTLALTALRPDPVLPADVMREYRRLTGRMDYNRDVRPILADKCFACHGPDAARRKAGLRLDESASAYGPLPESPGRVAVKPGRIDRSELMHRILSEDPGYRMPVPESHLELSATEKAVLARWVEQGAEYRPHWAFVKPEKVAPPELTDENGSLGVIDRFIRARLREVGMRPAPEADRETLLRRLSLDLTGLPPTLDEIDRFLADTSSGAYERQVDRMLASPHYGERMAADWLDVARFADSHGYTVDRMRDQSPWRDWVIAAFNRNMPYDRFIHEQLAGDLMPTPDRDMLIATAFNRNHPQNMEGGIVEEEFQTEYVMDRTNTFGEAFMALSVGCARCHDHKYDPIPQKDYYRLYAFFNNILEAGQISWNNDMPTPTLHLPTPVQEAAIASLRGRIRAAEQKVDSTRREALRRADAWVDGGGYGALAGETRPTAGLTAFFPLSGDLADRIDTARRGVMKHDAGATGDTARFVLQGGRRVLALDGDTYLDMSGAGAFRRSDPFTVGIRVWIPRDLQDGVIIHKSNAERLYNFKGFHIALRNGRFEALMAHTAPSNAIILQAVSPAPRERWVHLALAYDGSSRASGLRLLVDGVAQEMRVVKDRLTKDIIFHQTPEPGLQVGGWWRGTGFRGGMAAYVTAHDRMLTPFEGKVLAGVADWSDIARKPAASLSSDERRSLVAWRAETADTSLRASMLALKTLRAALSDTMRGVRDLMVMEEMPDPKPTFLLRRGRYDMPGERVAPGTPASILGYPSSLPANRYGLAQWLTHPDHPLTSRVAVNRLWQQFFGAGLVRSSEDFGNQGEMPSHPALLDWLAVDFRASGWDVKRMVRMIVLSRTYRQDSRANPAAREADPFNRLLARGPSVRLTAEMLRDNALAAAGLLRPDIGGPSFRPYQPSGLWDIKGDSYRADSSEQLHRRSLYGLVRRTVPNPTMSTFDAPDRSVCLSRRQRTNTPLQALVTLNDPTYLEACKALGERMARIADPEEAIWSAFRSLTGRRPTVAESTLLLDLHARQRQRFREQPAKASGWLKVGIHPTDKALPADLLAAHAVVASTILNSDATLTKR
jgi:hypothetical protein